MLEILVGQIPEAVYFSLFLIYAKNLKEKRLIFTILMVLEYLFLKHIIHLNYNILFQIIYTFFVYVFLKVLYKEKAQITDIFLFGISLLVLLAFTIPFLFLNSFINDVYLVCIISKICLFIFLFIIKKSLNRMYQKYYSHWNRIHNAPKKIKSLTLRNISIVIFNLLFYITYIIIENIK